MVAEEAEEVAKELLVAGELEVEEHLGDVGRCGEMWGDHREIEGRERDGELEVYLD